MTEDRTAFEGVSSATVLKPGDKVLVTLGRPANRAEVDMLSAHLRERFPEVDFAIISGAESVTVQPGVWQERIEEMWWAHYHREEAKLDDFSRPCAACTDGRHAACTVVVCG